MKQKALVKKTNENGTATVTVLRRSACSTCSSRHVCGTAKETDSVVNNPMGAKEGDTVEIEAPSGNVLKYSALVFFAPVALALILYLVLNGLGKIYGIIGAIIGFTVPFITAYIISKANAEKLRPTVTAILTSSDAEAYGENVCDLRNE